MTNIPQNRSLKNGSSDYPLVVDLDNSLLRTDLFVESVLKLLKKQPQYLFLLPVWLLRGRASVKHEVARRVSLDIAAMPFRGSVVDYLGQCRDEGRRLILATAADRRYADQVAAHMDMFDEVLASDGTRNLKGRVKASLLVERFGRGGFDYLGDSRSDLAVWRHARSALVVNPSPALERALGGADGIARKFA